MRTPDHQQQKVFFYISTEKRIPKDHPLRPIKAMAPVHRDGVRVAKWLSCK